MSDFHFMRPWMLLFFIPLIAIGVAFWCVRPAKSVWHKICQPQLLPYILKRTGHKDYTPYLVAMGLGLLILALAGPSFGQAALPLVNVRSGVVMVLDLSPSMDATDIKPSRLKRALFKISDILDRRKSGQTALVVFSEGAYVVTPMTDDVENIRALLSALDTSIMPKPGHDAKKGVAKGIELLARGGVVDGHILLITSELSQKELSECTSLANENGTRISLLGIGSEDNAPIVKPGGGFLTDSKGALVLSKLNKDHMYALAKEANGRFTMIADDDSDIDVLMSSLDGSGQREMSEKVQYASLDQGYWLLAAGLPFLAFCFRRGFLLSLLLLCPQGLQGYTWQDLWSTPDQQAEEHFHREEFEAAKEKFQDPDWQAAVNYRLGDYETSAQQYLQRDSLENRYNYATAKAKAGDLKTALKVYEDLLATHPGHEDALYNKQLIEDFLKQQSEQSPHSQPNEGQKSEDSEKSEKNQQDKPSGDRDKSEKNEPNKSDDERQDKTDGADGAGSPKTESEQQDKSSREEQEQSAEGKQKEELPSRQVKEEETTPAGEPSADMQQKYSAEMDEKLQNAKEDCTAERNAMKAAEEANQIDERWLKRVEDNPGELLRRKFLYQYKQQSR